MLFNEGGKSIAYVTTNPVIRKHFKAKYRRMPSHIGMGYMLRKLGYEANSGGQLFRHFSIKRKSFRGLTGKQIKILQRNS